MVDFTLYLLGFVVIVLAALLTKAKNEISELSYEKEYLERHAESLVNEIKRLHDICDRCNEDLYEVSTQRTALQDKVKQLEFYLNRKAPPSVVEIDHKSIPVIKDTLVVTKKRRSTQFTTKQRERIKAEYKKFSEDGLSLVHLVELLNKEFGYNKAFSSYQKVWSSKLE